ncbi:hypothetical protein ALC57_17990, partial [Trachymyrmex cornetzi]
NLGSGHPLSPLARLPGRPSRPSRAAEHSVLGRLMVRPGWRPLAVAHTHADWIGHCTPCSSASEQGNCVRSVRCSYTYCSPDARIASRMGIVSFVFVCMLPH